MKNVKHLLDLQYKISLSVGYKLRHTIQSFHHQHDLPCDTSHNGGKGEKKLLHIIAQSEVCAPHILDCDHN